MIGHETGTNLLNQQKETGKTRRPSKEERENNARRDKASQLTRHFAPLLAAHLANLRERKGRVLLLQPLQEGKRLQSDDAGLAN